MQISYTLRFHDLISYFPRRRKFKIDWSFISRAIFAYFFSSTEWYSWSVWDLCCSNNHKFISFWILLSTFLFLQLLGSDPQKRHFFALCRFFYWPSNHNFNLISYLELLDTFFLHKIKFHSVFFRWDLCRGWLTCEHVLISIEPTAPPRASHPRQCDLNSWISFSFLLSPPKMIWWDDHHTPSIPFHSAAATSSSSSNSRSTRKNTRGKKYEMKS